MTRRHLALRPALATLVLVALAPDTTRAATCTWDAGGTTDHKWSTAANWNPDGAPTFDATADLVFGPTYDPATGSTDVNLDGNRVVRSLSLDWGRATSTLTLQGGALTLRDVTRTTSTANNAQISFYGSGAGNHGTITLSGDSLWDHKAGGVGVIVNVYATLGDGGTGRSLTLLGSVNGAVFLYDNASHGGSTVIRGAMLRMQANNATDLGRISATPNILVTDGGTLSVKPWSYLTADMVNDNAAIRLYGGTYFFHDGQNSNGNSTPETNAVLRIGQGLNTLQGTGKAGYTCGMHAASLAFGLGGTLRLALPTGTAVGKVTLGAAPTLFGGAGGAGTTTRPILRGAFAGVDASTPSLVTYDATAGLVPLNRTTEFATSINGVGASTDQNVRRGSAETLTADRTVDGLVLDTGSFTVDGAYKLTVASGMVNLYGSGTTTLSMQELRFGGGTGFFAYGNSIAINTVLTDASDMVFVGNKDNIDFNLNTAGTWTGNTYIHATMAGTTRPRLNTGNNSERLPDATTLHLGVGGLWRLGNAVETVAGIAGVGTVQMQNNSARVVVGSGTAVNLRFVVGGGGTTGTLAPGLADDTFKTGTLTLNPNNTAGGVTLGANAVLNIDLAGTRAVSADFDVLNVSLGDVVLGGTLNVAALSGLTPPKDDTWLIVTAEKKAADTVSGSFATVTKGYTATRVDTNADTYKDAVLLTYVGLPAGGTVVLLR